MTTWADEEAGGSVYSDVDVSQAGSADLQNLTVAGNTTLGDSSADSLTINAGAWTIGANYTATRALGAAAAGAVSPLSWTTTLSGDAGGTTNLRNFNIDVTASGGNAISAVRPVRVISTISATALTSVSHGISSDTTISGSGGATSLVNFEAQARLTSSGNVGTAVGFQVTAVSLTSTGAITTNTGFDAGNLGNATLVTNAIGFNAAEMTASLTLTAGFRGQMTSGTGKYNLYMDGTAANYLAGPLFIGGATTLAGNVFEIQSTSSARVDLLQYTASNASGSIVFLKSRGTSLGSYTVVQNGDNLGQIAFVGTDGAASLTAATITAQVEGTPGTNDMPGRLSFATTADGASTPTNRVLISQNGSVVLNNSGSALATNATGGFTYIPSCAGTPTGVPASLPTGVVPLVWDSTNHKFYVYSGGAWKGGTTPGAFV